MADYGLLTEVRIEERTTSLTAAASVSDTELFVDSAGDLDEDGGTLELNGVQLEYSSTVMGDTEDDPDTVVLVDPLAVAADEDDEVTPVVGGLPAEDWYGIVDMGSGDAVPVPLSFSQRTMWAPGVYDPPVPVMVSEDLHRLEDAPGRPPSATGVEAWNLDEWTATADDANSVGLLTYLPRPNSLIVWKNGVQLDPSEWSLVGRIVTVAPSSEVIIRTGHKFTSYYLRNVAADTIDTLPDNPVEWGSSGPTLIVADGNTTNYSAPNLDDSAWSNVPAPLGYPVVPPDPFWSIPVATSTGTVNCGIWLRRRFILNEAGVYDISGRVDGQHWLYLDGVLIHSYTGPLSGVDNNFTVAAQALSAGIHVVAFHVNDDTPDPVGSDYIYGDVQVVRS